MNSSSEEDLPVFNDSSSLSSEDEDSDESSSESSSSEEEDREPQVIPPIKKRERPQVVPLYLRSPRRNIIPKFWFWKKAVRRNWLELPSEIMCMIFTKVGTIDILSRVQLVCCTWRKLAKEPELFRLVDINWHEIPAELHDYEGSDMIEKLVKEAVDRSCGQLVDFSIDDFLTDELIEYIIDKISSLRRLRLGGCFDISEAAVVDMTKKLPLLEELEIYCCNAFEVVVETFGRSCPLLKSFTLIYSNHDTLFGIVGDQDALSIARSMPELRHLDILHCLTDNALRAILDGCLHLNFLDLRHCSYLNFAGDLVKMCVERNIELRVSGKEESLKLITEMERRLSSLLQLQYKNKIPLFESLLQLQYEKPKCEHLEAVIDSSAIRDALSSYIKALHRTLTQMQSQLHTSTQILSQLQKLYQVQSKIVSLLKSMPDG